MINMYVADYDKIPFLDLCHQGRGYVSSISTLMGRSHRIHYHLTSAMKLSQKEY